MGVSVGQPGGVQPLPAPAFWQPPGGAGSPLDATAYGLDRAVVVVRRTHPQYQGGDVTYPVVRVNFPQPQPAAFEAETFQGVVVRRRTHPQYAAGDWYYPLVKVAVVQPQPAAFEAAGPATAAKVNDQRRKGGDGADGQVPYGF
jgi:hypothetical protein